MGKVDNVPSDVNTTVKSLTRTDSETIQVELIRKKSFTHHVMYECMKLYDLKRVLMSCSDI